MRNKNWITGFLLAAVLGLAACKDAPKQAAQPAPDAARPENLLFIYDQVGQAQRDGDIVRFINLRDLQEVARIEQELSAKNRQLDADALKEFAKNWPEPRDYHQTGVKLAGDLARMDLWKAGAEKDAAGIPKADFLILLFRKESDGWKLSRTASVSQAVKPTDALPVLSPENVPEDMRLP